MEKPLPEEPHLSEKPLTHLTQRSYLNAIAALLDYLSKVGVSFLVTPFLLAAWGSAIFGVWQVLNQLVSFAGAADGRPSQALKWMMASQQTSSDSAMKRRIIGSAILIWILFLPLMLGIGLILIIVAPSFVDAESELVPLVRLTAAVLVLDLFLTGIALMPAAVLRGLNLGYKRMWLVAGLNVLRGALMIAVVYMGLGLVGVASVKVIITLLAGALFWSIARSQVSWFGVGKPQKSEIKSFVGYNSWFLGSTIVNRALIATDVVMLGLLMSTSTVTSYTLTNYSSQMMIAIVVIITGAVLPGLGGLIGKGDNKKADSIRSEMMTYSWLMATTIGSTILLLNRSFVSLWVGAEQYAGTVVNILLILVMIQLIFIQNDARIIDLTLDLKSKVLLGGVAALLSILFSFLLIPAYGIIGLCISLIIGRLVLSISYPLLVHKFLKIDHSIQLIHKVKIASITGILLVAASYIGHRYETSNWIVWAVLSVLSMISISVLLLFIGISGRQRRNLFGRIRAIKLTFDL